MFVRTLAEELQVTSVMANRSIVAATANTGTAVDMQGYQSVMFILTSAAAAAANTPSLTAVYGSTSTPATGIASAAVPVGLNTTLQILELDRPSQRYVAPVVNCAINTTVTVIAIQSGREPQALGSGNPVGNLVPQNSSFNTTTGVFGGVMNVQSSSNTPTSINILANP